MRSDTDAVEPDWAELYSELPGQKIPLRRNLLLRLVYEHGAAENQRDDLKTKRKKDRHVVK